jgi:Frataxin-like domain
MQASKAFMIHVSKKNLLTARLPRGFLLQSLPTIAAAAPSLYSLEQIYPEEIHTRHFHATPAAGLSARRRRRRGDTGEAPKDEDMDTATTYEEHLPLTDPVDFEIKGQELLAKLGTAIEPMIAINDPFHVTRTQHMLKIAVEKSMGNYELGMEPEERIVVFRSPISGAHSYFFSQRTKEWVDTVDFHSLEGIFVRDLIRHCKGVPKL